jgi:DNA-3-methyladenine glycosylase II
MTQALPDESLRPALEALAADDPDLAAAYRRCGLPPLRSSPAGFPGLIRMIIGQQVSTASAAAIIARLEAACAPLSAEGFLGLDDEALRAVGFSRQKVRSGRALADAIASGRLAIEALPDLDDESAVAALVEVPGIGRWTAEIYLLFALRRPDIWPADDLAVVKAVQAVKGLAVRPGRKEMRDLGEAWRPHRSAAARLFWHYYRHAGVAL